ncbi:ABC transporter permease [Nocardia carnea]|uniref:ABC transporter permease n=1 Tax=Nocardia TaxID=1817 RepID=UPI0024586E56|nr:ABC transporter permease subunit [Nocardia carnea]
MNTRIVRALPGAVGAAVVIVAVLATWQAYAEHADLFFLPTPQQIVERLHEEWLGGTATRAALSDGGLTAIGQTFLTAGLAWLIAAVVGIGVGVLVGSVRAIDEISTLPFLLLRSIPGVALIPIFITIMGLGTDMRIAVVTVGCVWPILLNTAAAVSRIEPRYVDVYRVARQSRATRLWSVLLPATMPNIFAGLRVALSLSLIMTVAAEMLGGSGGLGALAARYQSTFDVPGLWATLSVLAVCGLLLNALIILAEDLLLGWHKKWRSVSE